MIVRLASGETELTHEKVSDVFGIIHASQELMWLSSVIDADLTNNVNMIE